MMMKEYPNVVAGSASPYFPPLYEKPDCAKCEKRRDCYSYGKYQRDRRDFTYTSGRCPRLPDMRKGRARTVRADVPASPRRTRRH